MARRTWKDSAVGESQRGDKNPKGIAPVNQQNLRPAHEIGIGAQFIIIHEADVSSIRSLEQDQLEIRTEKPGHGK